MWNLRDFHFVFWAWVDEIEIQFKVYTQAFEWSRICDDICVNLNSEKQNNKKTFSLKSASHSFLIWFRNEKFLRKFPLIFHS